MGTFAVASPPVSTSTHCPGGRASDVSRHPPYLFEGQWPPGHHRHHIGAPRGRPRRDQRRDPAQQRA